MAEWHTNCHTYGAENLDSNTLSGEMQQQAQINESFLKQLLSWHRFLNFSGKAGAVVFNKSSPLTLKIDKDKIFMKKKKILVKAIIQLLKMKIFQET